MSVSIKAYLSVKDESDRQEIRRFAIDTDVSTNFIYLQEKLIRIYSTLTRGEFSVFWKDEEGDLVIISSDEELVSAMTSTTGDVHKLYIQRQNATGTRSNANCGGGQDGASDEVHPRVTCDGCNGAIRGYRYKCMECPDYDLCFKCEDGRIHNHHVMLRLPKPADKQNAGSLFPWLFGRHFGRRGHHRGHGPWVCPRKQHRHGGTEEATGATPTGEPNPYQFQFQQVLEKIWTVLGGLPKDNKECSEESCTEGSTDEKTNNTPLVPPMQQEEFMKCVGETVAHMLDPLGIDVDIAVEHNGRYQTVGKQNSDVQTPPTQKAASASAAAAAYTSSQRVPIPTPKNLDEMDVQPAYKRCQRVPIPMPKNLDEMDVQPDVVLETPPMAAAKGSPAANITTTPISERLEAIGNCTPDRASPTLNQNADVGDWTYIGDKEKAMIPTIHSFPQLYPQVPQQAADAVAELSGVRPKTGPPTTSLAEEMSLLNVDAQHPNPAIRSALKQMMTMGFTNEGGWLTQLLEVKNGNIDSVLEVLAPVGKNTK